MGEDERGLHVWVGAGEEVTSQDSGPGTRISKPESRPLNPETRIPKPETQIPPTRPYCSWCRKGWVLEFDRPKRDLHVWVGLCEEVITRNSNPGTEI